MERKTKTRPPTAAERHAARALGRPEPDEVEVDVTSPAEQHAAHLIEPRKSAKPKNVQTFDWYARRTQGASPEVVTESVTVADEEPRPLPGWARRMAYRPGGGDAA